MGTSATHVWWRWRLRTRKLTRASLSLRLQLRKLLRLQLRAWTWRNNVLNADASVAELLILSLATWRLAHLLAREEGPFALVKAFRERVGGALACLYCASVWCAALLLLAQQVAPMVIWVLAISGGALLLHRYTGGDYASSA